MIRCLIPGVFAAALALAPQVHAAAAQDAEAGAAPAGEAESGRHLYSNVGCYQCHGLEAHAGPGGRLAPDPIPFVAFTRYVRQPTGGMPPYTPLVLSEQQLADIYAFLRTIPEPPPLEGIRELNVD